MRDKLVIGTNGVNNQYRFLSQYLGITMHQRIDWLDTAITYNNDYYLSQTHSSMKIISKISPFMAPSYEFWVSNHLRCLNRKFIDIMLVHNSRSGNWLSLYGKLIKDKRFHETGVSDFSIQELETINQTYGSYPTWLEIEINPRYPNLELIDFCKDKGIKIIAYAIFGGKYNARKNIQAFTLPYLLWYALSVADKVIIRWDSNEQFTEILNALDAKVMDFNWGYENDLEVKKSIVPEKYDLPLFMPFDNDGFPIYFHEDKIANVSKNWFEGKDRNRIDDKIPYRLEFITEYQALLRYLDRDQRVVITEQFPDARNRVTKVMTRNSKVFTKAFNPPETLEVESK